MTGRPSLPVLKETLDPPGTLPVKTRHQSFTNIRSHIKTWGERPDMEFKWNRFLGNNGSALPVVVFESTCSFPRSALHWCWPLRLSCSASAVFQIFFEIRNILHSIARMLGNVSFCLIWSLNVFLCQLYLGDHKRLWSPITDQIRQHIRLKSFPTESDFWCGIKREE